MRVGFGGVYEKTIPLPNTILMKKILFVAIVSVIVACGVSKVSKVDGPVQADVDRVTSYFPGYSLANLKDGKVLYEKNCSTCHELKKPNSESDKGWKHHVPEMVEKANHEGQKISAEQEQLILKYLLTMGPYQSGGKKTRVAF
jgi:cytochrome c5